MTENNHQNENSHNSMASEEDSSMLFEKQRQMEDFYKYNNSESDAGHEDNIISDDPAQAPDLEVKSKSKDETPTCRICLSPEEDPEHDPLLSICL